MTQQLLRGLAASGGIATGRVLVVRDLELNGTARGEDDATRALEALTSVAEELGRLAELARASGREEEAEILEANRLMAEDPALREEVAALAAEAAAHVAVRDVTDRHAALLASLDDPYLAARAADVRQLGQRAARLLVGGPGIAPTEPAIVLARDLGPADVAELQLARGRVLGIALAEGAATSHAAIMARSLGLPMAVGLGDSVLETADGGLCVLDGDNGVLVLEPSTAVRRRAEQAIESRSRERDRLVAMRGLRVVTRDGREIRLLCNAATPAEVEAGLEAGSEGVGLLRTELAFLESGDWPTEAQHTATLEPPLSLLAGRVATVRTLDFGADKTPPFLVGIEQRGLALALSQPAAFMAQLRAILHAGRRTQLRVLLPLVESAEQFRHARALLLEALDATAWTGPPPQLGAMIETPDAAARAAEIAEVVDFLSIGTNDLVQYTLGLDRELPLASAQSAADPRVLRLVAEVIDAAHARELGVEVCGEAAGEPPVAALLVGVGVDELSVSPARVDEIRALVRGLSAEAAGETASGALASGSVSKALALANELLRSGELGDERREVGNGLGGVLA